MFTQAMFSEQRVFVIDYALLEAAKPDVAELEQTLAGHGNVLIIYTKTKPDKRTQLFKAVTKLAATEMVSPPRGADLQRWLLNRAKELGATSMASQAAAELIFLSGTNMLALENELIKVINYNSAVTIDSIRALATRDIQTNIFDLVDSVVQGNTAKALRQMEEMFRSGAAEPYILHMLARQYRLLFRLLFYRQKGYGSPEIQKIMPMHPFAFQKLTQQAASMELKQCAENLQQLLKADYLYKSGRNQGLHLLQTLTYKLAKK